MNRETRTFLWGLLLIVYSVYIIRLDLYMIQLEQKFDIISWLSLICTIIIFLIGYKKVKKTID